MNRLTLPITPAKRNLSTNLRISSRISLDPDIVATTRRPPSLRRRATTIDDGREESNDPRRITTIWRRRRHFRHFRRRGVKAKETKDETGKKKMTVKWRRGRDVGITVEIGNISNITIIVIIIIDVIGMRKKRRRKKRRWTRKSENGRREGVEMKVLGFLNIYYIF